MSGLVRRREKEGVLKAKKASAAARATSPPISAAAMEFCSWDGGSGVIGAGPFGRGTLAIWPQRNPPTLCSPWGGWRGEKSLSNRSSRGPYGASCPRVNPGRAPKFVAKILALCAAMPNRNMETVLWGRKNGLLSLPGKGEHSRLAPQELCPPSLGNRERLYSQG